MPILSSELILNSDGSIYHLNLLPEDIANTIITVGDPDRVEDVSMHFDSIELRKGKREFKTHTGFFNGKRISVISTGIGTDNIDIVFNELDALVNIDFDSRLEKEKKTTLNFIRIGTSGAIQADIPIDSWVMSTHAIGLDSLMHFYDCLEKNNAAIEKELHKHLDWKKQHIVPYVFDADESLASRLKSKEIQCGITTTNAGFYGPQGRILRLVPSLENYYTKLTSFNFNGKRITNLEMETAGIYGLAKILGHKAISMNAILANRTNGTFSKTPSKTVHNLISYCLEKIT